MSRGTEDRPEISIVIPVYRNAETLEPLSRRLHETLAAGGFSHELLFVDDGCPEGSAAILRKLAAERREVRAIRLERNVGQHAAVLIGLAHARGDWCVTMDADLQDRPEAVTGLLAARDGRAAAVFGARRGLYESRKRRFTSRLYKWCLHRLCGVPKDAGTFVGLRRDLVERLLNMRTERPSIVAMIGCAGLPWRSIPIVRQVRPIGRSSYRSRDRLASAARAFACTFEQRLRPAARPYMESVGCELVGERL